MVEASTPVIEVGLKPTVTPAGWPVADREMVESKPSACVSPTSSVTVLVIVEVPELPPCAIETEPGEDERLKPGVDELPASAVIRPVPFGLP
jgi:hypothetical protein